MQRQLTYAILTCAALLLSGCRDVVMTSSVPNAPVQLKINTEMAEFVHFTPTNLYTYCLIDGQGYHYAGVTRPLTQLDYIGYAGVVVYIDNYGYSAYDLCCPHCRSAKHPVEVDGMFAICPQCGEQFDLASGYAIPQQGICRETLRRYNVRKSGPVLTISDR